MLQALLSVADDVSRLLENARHEAATEIVRRAASHLPGAVDRLVLQRYYRLALLLVTILVATGAVCAAVGFWFGSH